MCKWHYEQWRKRATVCIVLDCDKPQFASGWCSAHYTRNRRYGDINANHDPKQEPICTVDGCEKSTYRSGRGLCKNHYLRQYLRENPPAPGSHRPRTRKYILKQYGLTPADYDRMVAEQDGRCAICRTDSPGRGKPSWNVDHDHETGAVRGLLCHNCNMALGMLGDCVETAQALVSYLLAHRGGDA